MKAGNCNPWKALHLLALVAVLTAATVMVPVEPALAGGGVTAEVKSGNLVITIDPSSPEIKNQFANYIASGDESSAPSARVIAGGQVVKTIPLDGPYIDNVERTGSPDAPFQIVLPIRGELGVPGQVSIQVSHQGGTLDSTETSIEPADIGGVPGPGGREEGQEPGGSRSGEPDRTEPGGSRSEEPGREEPRDPQPPTVEEPEDPERLDEMGRDIANALAKVLSQTPEDVAQLDSVSQKTYSRLNKNAPLMPHWDELTEMQKQKVMELLVFALYAKYLSRK